MRSQLSPVVFLLGVIAAGAAGAAAKAPAKTPAPAPGPSLTLYERADFAGRHATFHAAADTVRRGFVAHSAKSTGVWTLCEGRDPGSKCQTISGSAAKLKIEPAIVRPGVEAVALFEKPQLQGRRMLYSFASDIPPPFRARSARTWGGPWTLCDAVTGKCQVVDSEKPVPLDVQVGLVKPGRAPEKAQLAKAAPAKSATKLAEASPPPAAVAADPAPEPESTPEGPPPDEVASAAPPPAEVEAPPPEDMPPPALAEASPPPEAAQPESPYVEVPIPPREAEAAPPAEPDQEPVLRAPEPPRAAPPDVRVRRVAYQCQDGRALTVMFDDREATATVLAQGEDPQSLHRTEGASGGGFFYEGSGHVLFGAGGRAGYASRGQEPVDCYARAPRRELSAIGEDDRFYPDSRDRRRQYDSDRDASGQESGDSW